MDPLPSNFQFLLILLVLLMVLVTYRYLSRRSPHPTRKQLNVDSPSGSEATDSEPEVELKGKSVDKMDRILEENNDLYNSTDSEEYSMQRMVEEYQRSRTLKKKVSEVLEEISDTFKRKSIEIKKQFGPAPTPAVIVPMSMQERLDQINKNKTVKAVKRSKKEKKIKVIVKKRKEDDDQMKDNEESIHFEEEKENERFEIEQLSNAEEPDDNV
eukprot:181770_1